MMYRSCPLAIVPFLKRTHNMLALKTLLLLFFTELSSTFPFVTSPALEASENVYDPVDVALGNANLGNLFPDNSDNPRSAFGQNDLDVSLVNQPLPYLENKGGNTLDPSQNKVCSEPVYGSAKSDKNEGEAEVKADFTAIASSSCPSTSATGAASPGSKEPAQNPQPGSTAAEENTERSPVDCKKIPGNPRRLFCCEKGPPTKRSGAPKKEASALTRRRECRACRFHVHLNIRRIFSQVHEH